MNTTYKSNNNIVYSCKYHVVWCSKYRRKVLTNGVDVRLRELLQEICCKYFCRHHGNGNHARPCSSAD